MGCINPTDHIGLVKMLAQEFARRNHLQEFEVDDLIQDGTLGLLRAAEKFDPSRGVSFATYARWWIEATMRREFAFHHDFVRVPIRKYQKGLRVARPLSLDAHVEGTDGLSLNDCIGEDGDSPEDAAAQREERELVWAKVAELPERTQMILFRRFVEDKTLEEIGQEFGLVRERVRQIELQALKALRSKLQSCLDLAA